jgi:hypothetical protein
MALAYEDYMERRDPIIVASERELPTACDFNESHWYNFIQGLSFGSQAKDGLPAHYVLHLQNGVS